MSGGSHYSLFSLLSFPLHICYINGAASPTAVGGVRDNFSIAISKWGGFTVKVGTRLAGGAPAEIAESARRAERVGFDTVSSSETNHNPFLPLPIAAEHTERVGLRTSIALSFARSPMDMAYIGWTFRRCPAAGSRWGSAAKCEAT